MKKLVLAGLCVILMAQTAFALEFPQPRGFVNDFAGLLAPREEQLLEQTLADFERETSHEIAVVTVESLQEIAIEDYAVELFAEWGIGKKDADNGALLLVAPNEREARIEVGYGLEPVLTDAASSQIMQNILVPAFKQGDFSGGISEAVNVMMGITKGEIVDVPEKRGGGFGAGYIIPLLIFIYLFVYRPTAGLRKSKWGTKFTYRTLTAFWFPVLFAGGTLAVFAGLFAGVFLAGILLDILFWKFFKNTPNESMPWWMFIGRGGGFGGGFGGGGFGGFGGGFSGGGGVSGRW